MAKMQAELAGDVIALGGLVEFPTAAVKTLAPMEANARGIVLANERKNLYIEHDGKLIAYTMSIYVQRAALSDDEAAEVERTAKDRDANKRAREQAEQEKREREIKRAQELGSDAVISAINRLGSGIGDAHRLLHAVGGK